MENESLIVGNSNWAVKANSLLGYAVGEASGKYVPREFTFTRNSTATYTDENGIIQTAAANIARVQNNALLLEPQRTNLLQRSDEFDNVYWEKVGVSVTANNTTSPDGTTNADKLTSSGAGSDEYIQRTGLTTTAGTYTSSIFVKNVNATISVLMAVHLGEGSQTSDMRYNWSTNTITTAGTNVVSSKATNYGNGWVCLELTYTIGASVTGHWYRVYTQTGTSTNSIFLYGAQVELGAYPTSYIPTTSASATRVADDCVKTGISSLIGQTEGTMFVQVTAKYKGADIASINTGVANAVYIVKTSNNYYRAIIYAGGVSVLAITQGAVIETSAKIAVVYKSGSTSLFINGTKIQTDTTTYTFTTALNSFYFQPNYLIGLETNEVQQSCLFPTALTDAQCQELTTL